MAAYSRPGRGAGVARLARLPGRPADPRRRFEVTGPCGGWVPGRL